MKQRCVTCHSIIFYIHFEWWQLDLLAADSSCAQSLLLIYENCKQETLKMLKIQICTHTNTFTGIDWLISTTHSLKPSLCGDTKHSSQQCTAEPTPLIYHVNFSNSPCSPCWPDNPCRQLQTNNTDRKGNCSWGSAQCVSGYDTPVNQM